MTTGSIPASWRGNAARYRMMGSKCTKEGNIIFPPRVICPKCGAPAEEDYVLSGKGKLVNYTVIHVPPRHQELMAPYVVGVIQLEEGPRVTAQIVGVEIENVAEALKPEIPMVSTFRKYSSESPESVIVYGYKFMPSSLYLPLGMEKKD